MPYVEKEFRDRYAAYEDMPVPTSGADLNYVVCRLLARFTQRHGLHYRVIAEARDGVSGALDEYNRCVVHPYEEEKRRKNGCVWGILADDPT